MYEVLCQDVKWVEFATGLAYVLMPDILTIRIQFEQAFQVIPLEAE